MKENREQKSRVLLVDDEPFIIKALKRILRGEDIELYSAETGERALSILEEKLIDVILLDINLPDISGLDILRHAKQMDPETVVVMMTGYGTVRNAVEAIKEGAFEFLTKPFEGKDLIPITVRRALQYKMLREENRQLQGMVSGRFKFSNMVGNSASMQRIMRLVPRLADIDSTILISGESGTGKEVLARAIHYSGGRRQHSFVPVDCGAIPEGIIESELFGHLKGAFTGASHSTTGLIKKADKGTAFFDEIGELPLNMQTRLLRFLQESQVRPIGGTNVESVDVRVITATNKNLAQAVAEGRFREDLFYRLNVVNIEIPPLRDRKEDIPALIKFFMDKYSPKLNNNLSISPEAFEYMVQYSWPGNIRELENVIIQILSLSTSDVIRLEHLPASIRSLTLSAPITPTTEDIPLSLEAYERLAIQRAIKECNGNIIEAAKLLNLGKSTLYRKIKDLDIDIKSIG